MNLSLLPTSPLSLKERRERRGIFTMIVIASLALFFFSRGSKTSSDVTFGLVLGNEWILIKEWVLDSDTGSRYFSAASLVFAMASLLFFTKNKSSLALKALFGASILMAVMCWAAAGKFIPLTGLLQGGLLLSVPLIFGALAGVLCERSGVINIAIEGHLLAGAFAAGVAASLFKTPWAGLIFAPIAGALISLLLAIFAIKYAIDQVILGFVLNVLVIGLTTFAYKRVLIPHSDIWNSGSVLSVINIPILSKLPILGPIFFSQTIIVYALYVLVVVIQIGLFKTRWGLRMRSVGEHPTAAESVGIDVNKTRFRNVILSGAVAGLGGAYFTVGAVGAFSREMTAGMGFIALAALIFGKWTPMGAVGAALVFGFADNFQSVLSITGTPIPSAFMLMVPYIATIIAVSGFVGRVRAPAADGIAYKRGGASH